MGQAQSRTALVSLLSVIPSGRRGRQGAMYRHFQCGSPGPADTERPPARSPRRPLTRPMLAFTASTKDSAWPPSIGPVMTISIRTGRGGLESPVASLGLPPVSGTRIELEV